MKYSNRADTLYQNTFSIHNQLLVNTRSIIIQTETWNLGTLLYLMLLCFVLLPVNMLVKDEWFVILWHQSIILGMKDGVCTIMNFTHVMNLKDDVQATRNSVLMIVCAGLITIQGGIISFIIPHMWLQDSYSSIWFGICILWTIKGSGNTLTAVFNCCCGQRRQKHLLLLRSDEQWIRNRSQSKVNTAGSCETNYIL